MQLSLSASGASAPITSSWPATTDQTIYSFTGATPEAFLDPDIPDNHKITLKQSYRVPRAVHRLAEEMIRRVARRQQKEYLPRPEDGALDRFSRDGYKRTEIAIVPDAMKQVEQGKTVMFLASCSYMLRPLIQVLESRASRFTIRTEVQRLLEPATDRQARFDGQPHRVAARGPSGLRRRSPPVDHGRRGAVGGMAPGKGVLRHGVKAKLNAFDISQPATIERMDGLFEPGSLDSLMAAWMPVTASCWLVARPRDRGRGTARPVSGRHRRQAGPTRAAGAPTGGGRHDPLGQGRRSGLCLPVPGSLPGGRRPIPARRRLARCDDPVFYVGATRARERLYICQAESAMRISI